MNIIPNVPRDRSLAGWIVSTLAAMACVVASGAFVVAQSRTAPIDVQEFTLQYCIDCHSGDTREAGLAIDLLDAHQTSAARSVWERILRKLRHRQMPPMDVERPDESTYEAVSLSLETSLDRAASAQLNPGRTDTFRRITRTEYKNAIRDMLALDVDVSSLLPKDEVSHGFDNVTVGELSPTLLERYLAAAKKISALAIGRPVSAPRGRTVTIPLDRTQEKHLEGLPFGTRGGGIVSHNFPLDAEYDIQLLLTRDRNEKVEGLSQPHELVLLFDGKLVQGFTVKPPRGRESHDSVDKHFKVRIPVDAGAHELGVAFLTKTSALIESERQPHLAHFNADRHRRIQPALYSVSIVGPYNVTGSGETHSRNRVFVCYPSDASEEERCGTAIIQTLMRRAYRRRIKDDDLQTPLALFHETNARDGFEAGIETALRAILVSPQFLFRMERDPAGVAAKTPYRLSDVELASRLSFFVWSSIPDDELLDVATSGELRKPHVLEQQVQRMLADQRSSALVNNFAAQWLYLRNLDSTKPDPRAFLDFDDNLRQALRRETELFLGSVIREDCSVLELLRSDYTFVNERLAKHYGIPNIYGSQFRRIDLGTNSHRGGLLSHGSVLTVTSYANRTSPILRGKWILTNILGAPPNPPPPEVPQLKEKNEAGASLSLRERIAEHRKSPVCASCHEQMDPLGFALEHFDAIGRWRTDDDGAAIDASGGLPDGTEFDGVADLQQALLKRPELFVSTIVEKLLTYALGRGLEYYDAPAVRKIVRDARQDEYRFSTLVLGVVKSTPFQMRTSQ